jgi:hypothetical protein
MEAYCFKCRAKREISNPEAVTLKNGRPATQGTCPTCGTKVFRIGKGSRRHRIATRCLRLRPGPFTPFSGADLK